MTNLINFTGRNEIVAKVMFLQVSICPQGGRVSASVHAGMPDPPGPGTPLRPGRPPNQAPPWDQADPPGPDRHPPDQADPPNQADMPPWEADSSIRSTSGRYASYWNAFLSSIFVQQTYR